MKNESCNNLRLWGINLTVELKILLSWFLQIAHFCVKNMQLSLHFTGAEQVNNQPGHTTSDMTCTVIEQVSPAKDPFLRKRREQIPIC